MTSLPPVIRVVIVTVGVLGLFLLLAFMSANIILTNEPVMFAIQTVAGNWSPSSGPMGLPKDVNAFWFSFSAFIALLLNVGALLLLLENVRTLYNLRKEVLMNTASLFDFRDVRVKDELLQSLPKLLNVSEDKLQTLSEEIEACFQRGKSKWQDKTLVNMLGSKYAADEYIKSLQKQTQAPDSATAVS
jgi:hypothetical protein